MGNLYTRIGTTHAYRPKLYLLHELKVAWRNKDFKSISYLQSKLATLKDKPKIKKERPTSFSWASRGANPNATINK